MGAPQMLEDYFIFLDADDIRVKGTRIGIEHILYEHIHNAKSPEAIAEYFPTVTLEQVYATILYYLQNRESVGQYIADWLEYSLKAEAEQDANPPLIVERLQQLKQSKLVA
jgi:uncharacterized protein (DUF433 family)